ncbi:MAG TPA: hypothetical protein VHY48_04210 [Acidobacteriaceae bacterium]|jgi:hypothetical protein|nr:hypothetical protein [Acidobacteriaceae bacterium]
MAATPLFTCVCGVQKKTSNHWILAIRTSHDIRFIPWDANLAMDDNVTVLCGERCAAGLLSRALGDWKQADLAAGVPTRPVAASLSRPVPAASASAMVS